MSRNLLNGIRVQRGVNAMSCASTLLGTAVDTANYDGVLFIAVGSSLLEGSTKIKLQAALSTASGGTYVKSNLYSYTTSATGSFNGKMLCLDVYRPNKRYVKPVIAGASSGKVYLRSMVTVLYGGRRAGSTEQSGSTYVGVNGSGYKTIVGATS